MIIKNIKPLFIVFLLTMIIALLGCKEGETGSDGYVYIRFQNSGLNSICLLDPSSDSLPGVLPLNSAGLKTASGEFGYEFLTQPGRYFIRYRPFKDKCNDWNECNESNDYEDRCESFSYEGYIQLKAGKGDEGQQCNVLTECIGVSRGSRGYNHHYSCRFNDITNDIFDCFYIESWN